MKPLIVLLVVFAISLVCNKLFLHQYSVHAAGRIAMAVMLLFTSIGHFKFPKGMSLMIPEPVPFKIALVYITGIFEIVAGICLLLASTNVITGWLLIAFFITIVPANIYAAVKHVDFEKGNYEGKGPSYLWFRIPLQLFFIAWIYFSVLV